VKQHKDKLTRFLDTVILNWQKIFIIISLIVGAYNHFKETKDSTTTKQQTGLLWHEDHQIEAGNK
jgi:hypothetical protein